MSYIEKEEDKKVEDNKDNKKENLFSAIFAEDTMVEDPEDVIKTDTNPERKELFKKTYAALLSMFSYDTDKKKKKKTKANERDIQNEVRVRGDNIPESVKVTVERKQPENNERESQR